MGRRKTVAILVLGILAAGVAVACTLNPQPLPPEFGSGSANDSDASARDGGFAPETPDPKRSDAGGGQGDASANDPDAGTDASDAGDGATDADSG